MKIKYSVNKKYIAKKHKMKSILNRYVEAIDRTRIIKKHCQINDKKLLDFGSGSGTFGGYIKENIKGVETWLYDPSNEGLDRSKTLFLFKDNFLFSDVNKLPNDYFKIITCWSVYAYIPEKKEFWNIMNLKLKKGGFLFIQVDNPKGLYYKLFGIKKSKEWNIEKRDINNNFKLIKIHYCIPTHYFQSYFNKENFIYKVLRICELIFEKVCFMPSQKIYVLRKI